MGTTYRGPADIARVHRALFRTMLKNTRMYVRIHTVQFPAADTAVVLCDGDVGKRARRRSGKVQILTAVRHHGTWMVASFQNTKRMRIYERIGTALTPDMRPMASQFR